MSERVAVVVGGGSGMGAAAARRLAADGFRIAILSSSGKGEALGTELGGIGVTGSNQSSDDLSQLVDVVLDRWGRIDVLVNSAGHGPKGPVLELTDEQWHAGLEVYLLNVIRAARLVAPAMVKQKGGAIVNISSAWALEPSPMFPTSAVFRLGGRRLHHGPEPTGRWRTDAFALVTPGQCPSAARSGTALRVLSLDR